jgi:serine protease Do
MVRNGIIALALTTMVLSGVVSAADTEKVMADISAKTKGSLAILSYKIKDASDAPINGQAVCIDSSGLFITTYLDAALRSDMIKEMQLIMPGKEAKTYKAKLLGVDPGSGLGFVQSEEKGEFTAVEFVPEPKLVPGQQVFSAGIMAGDGNRSPYLGTAYVSATLRVPGPLIYVTGGKLTNICSPVFTADGKAVGLVGRQLPLTFQTNTQSGPVNMALRGEEETSFFLPSDEFAYAIRKEAIPKEGEIRRPPWLGIGKFEAVNEDNAKLRKIELPAIIVGQVIKTEPAAKAGLQDDDIILEVDGQKFEKLANPSFAVQNFMRQITKYQMGQKVKLTVLSGTEKKDVTVTVGPMPQLPNEANRLFDQSLGFVIREKVPLDQYLTKTAAATNDGLIVLAVYQRSPADEKGITAGDLVTHINDQAVKTRDAYKMIAEASAKKGEPIKLTLFHGDGKQPISVILTPQKPAAPQP